MARKFFVGGNLNGTHESLSKISKTLNEADLDPNVEVVVAPSPLYVLPIKQALGSKIAVAAQTAYKGQQGAFTGEVSTWQLAQEKIPWVILGHSERRTIFKESSELIAEKTADALTYPELSVIFCVGETLEEREANKTDAVVQAQLEPLIKLNPDWSRIVIAYEPVWAIGTGKVATPEQAQEAHAAIRAFLEKAVSKQVADSVRLIYGGSVAAKNAKELAAGKDIDGFLVGGASLKPEFVDIINVNKA